MDVSGRGEFAAIGRLTAALPAAPAGQTWMGDDAAVLDGLPGALLLATDGVVAGVHTDLGLAGLDDLGWKAIAVNVSDIAAMGGRPVAVVVAVAGPHDTDLDLLYDGVRAATERWECPVVGGDLIAADTLVVTVTILGDGSGAPPPVTRSGARPGEALLVTGPLGSSAAGLRELRGGIRAGPCIAAYRRPQARLAEGRTARQAGATAMIDVSDGLGADLGHLLDASGVGVRLVDVPVAEGATRDEAMRGGEDYELVFSAPDTECILAAFDAAGLRSPLVLGLCTEDPSERTLGGLPFAAAGWEHPWD